MSVPLSNSTVSPGTISCVVTPSLAVQVVLGAIVLIAVTCPSASTVTIGIAVLPPYDAAVTPLVACPINKLSPCVASLFATVTSIWSPPRILNVSLFAVAIASVPPSVMVL